MALQAITIADQHYDRAVRTVDFIKRHVFPGGFLPSVTAVASAATRATDLRLIHLVRDGRGVIWSLMKPNKKTLTKVYKPAPSWRTTKYWISANLQSTWVYHRVPREKRERVRYEDFVTDPASTLHRIGALLDVDMSSLARTVAARQPIQANHTVGGSSVRMSRDIRVRADFAWQDLLPARDRKIFWLLAGWLAQRYGYTQQPG